MGRDVWTNIAHSKGFYARTYHKAIRWTIGSLVINLCLVAAIYFVRLHQFVPGYYATSGVKDPVPLTPLNVPNHSSNYLLEPDPVDQDEVRPLPQ